MDSRIIFGISPRYLAQSLFSLCVNHFILPIQTFCGALFFLSSCLFHCCPPLLVFLAFRWYICTTLKTTTDLCWGSCEILQQHIHNYVAESVVLYLRWRMQYDAKDAYFEEQVHERRKLEFQLCPVLALCNFLAEDVLLQRLASAEIDIETCSVVVQQLLGIPALRCQCLGGFLKATHEKVGATLANMSKTLNTQKELSLPLYLSRILYSCDS